MAIVMTDKAEQILGRKKQHNRHRRLKNLGMSRRSNPVFICNPAGAAISRHRRFACSNARRNLV
jgi:hypothetical protein